MHLSLLWTMARSAFVKRYYPVLIEGEKSKKCDKQLTHIVRVICRVTFKNIMMYESSVVQS